MRTRLKQLSFVSLTLFAFAATVSAANVTLNSADPGNTSSMNSAGKWDNGQAPASTNDYFTAAYFMRTPPDGNNYTFAGHSLTLQQPSGQGAPMRSLLYKGSGGNIYTINNLTNAAGGVLNNGGSGNVAAPTFTGNQWTIAGDSTILSDQGSTIVGYPLAGSSTLTNTSGQARTITYNGSLSGFTGKFYIFSSCTVALGAGSSNLGNPASLMPDQITIGAGCTLSDTVGFTFNNPNSGITLLGPGNATISAATATIISEPITDLTNGVTSASSLTKNGAGTLTLSGVNNYSGATTITLGTLQVGAASALPQGTAVTDNGVLDLNGISVTIGGLSGSGTVDTLTAGTPTLTVGANNGGGTLTGTIQNTAGTLSLTKIGSGTLTLAGGYNYGGQTLVAGGTLALVTSAVLPLTAGSLVISNGATLTVTANNGIPLPAGSLVVGTNSTLNVTLVGNASGIIPSGSLTFQDSTTNIFNYGSLLANPTTPAINAAGGISAPGANIVLRITGLGLQTGTFSLIKYTGAPLANVANFSVDLPPGVAGILVNNPGNDSIDVQITSIPSQLSWYGANGTSWDLVTANWSNVLGGITVFQQYTNGAVIAGDSVRFDDTLTNDFNNPQPTNITLNSQFFAFPLVVDSTLPYSVSGLGGIKGPTSLVKSNAGTFTLNTSNSFTGGTFVYGGTLAINNDSALGAASAGLQLNGGNLQITGNSTNNVRPISLPVASSIGVSAGATARVGGVISGAGGLSKTDNGTLVFGGNDTFANNLFVKAGTVVIDSGGSLTNTSTSVWYSIGQNLNDTGTLTLRGTGSLFNGFDFNIGDVDSSSGVVNIQDSATLTINNLFVASANSAGSTATGIVNQIGGTVNQLNTGVGTFSIGGRNQTSSAAAVGVYNISGSAVLNAAAGIRVGGGGTGTINQNGGTINARQGINIARLPGSVGTNNLNGGTLATFNVASSTAVNAVFNFNGGTLQAAFNPGNPFMSGLSQANVLAGGAIIDASTNNIVISQALLAGSPGGGLTKLGAGMLTLSGVNTFTGPITNKAGTLFLNSASTYAGSVNVNAGTLQLTTASILQGPTIVTNGATLSVIQLAPNANASLNNLTFNGGASGSGGTLGLTMTSGNNQNNALLSCATLTLNGTNTINLAAANIGTIALVKYTGAIAGSGNITNLTLPQGGTGYISNNAALSTIFAVITSTGPGLTWTGTNSTSPNLWDINTTTNWLVNAIPTSYHQIIIPGDAVLFNDVGSGSVTLNTIVSPASIVISNNTKTYTFSGSGGISGASGLLKLGTGMAILSLTNDTYLGDTSISNGTLQVANNGTASGLSSANLSIGPSGILRLSSASANAVTTVGQFSGSGAINYTGGNNSILTFGSSVDSAWNGSITDAGGGGLSLTKVGSATWTVGGANHLNNGDYFNAVSQIQMNNGTTIITNGGLIASAYDEFWIAQGAGSTSTVVVAGGTLAVSNNWLVVGRGDATANGTLIINSGTVTKAGNNNIIVGSTGASGTLIVNGGQVLNTSSLLLGENAGANGTLHLNGGLIQANQVRPNGAAPNSSIAYFNGGTLQATANTNDFINVGTTPLIQSGGAVIDDGGFAIAMSSQLFSEDPSSTGGGLIKKGAGTLYLDMINTYTGATIVTNGTLAGIGTIASPVVVGPAGNISAGDAGGPISMLTINNTLTIQGKASLRIDKTAGTPTADLISGITTANYGGTLVITNTTADATLLVAGDSFPLFSATTHNGTFASIVGSPGPGLAYSFANGVLSVITAPLINPNPTNITFKVVSGSLQLSWPADHQGWTLQTNSVGLNVASAWGAYPGSTSVTNVSIPLDPTRTNVFFRLFYVAP
jgi:autotransporter-associated beta strand protein